MSASRTQVHFTWYTSESLFSAEQVVSRQKEHLEDEDFPGNSIVRPFMTDVVIEMSSSTGVQKLTMTSDSGIELKDVVNFVCFFCHACLGGKLSRVTINGRTIDTILLQHVEAVDEAVRGLKKTQGWIKDERIASIRRNLQRNTVLDPRDKVTIE